MVIYWENGIGIGCDRQRVVYPVLSISRFDSLDTVPIEIRFELVLDLGLDMIVVEWFNVNTSGTHILSQWIAKVTKQTQVGNQLFLQFIYL